jgi:hypothetical protein
MSSVLFCLFPSASWSVFSFILCIFCKSAPGIHAPSFPLQRIYCNAFLVGCRYTIIGKLHFQVFSWLEIIRISCFSTGSLVRAIKHWFVEAIGKTVIILFWSRNPIHLRTNPKFCVIMRKMYASPLHH